VNWNPDPITWESRPAADVPTEIELVVLIRQHDYEMAWQRLRLAQQTYQDLDVVRENVMNGLAHRLRANGELDAAISLFRLNIQVHPNSIRAHDGFADAYLSNGDSLMVIRTYEQLLESLPLDTTMSQSTKHRIRQNAELRLRILQHTRPENAGASRFPAYICSR
jgi:tetratricopeptide (TPR) repeat protein